MSRKKTLGLPFGEIYSMTNIVRNRDRGLTTELALVGLTLPEWRALRIIYSFDDDVPMSALSEHSQTDRTALSRTLDRLVDRGWIARIPDPVDKRAVFIRRLGPADDVFERARCITSAFDKRLMQAIGPSDRTVLARVLTLIESTLAAK